MNYCADQCDQLTTCVTFVVDVPNQVCTLYNSLATGGNVDPNFDFGERLNNGPGSCVNAFDDACFINEPGYKFSRMRKRAV